MLSKLHFLHLVSCTHWQILWFLRSYILCIWTCIKYPITLQEHHLQVMQRTFGISNRSYFGHISPIVPHTFERIEDIGRVISVLLCPNLPGGRAPHWAEQGHYFTAVTISSPSIFFSICSIFILIFILLIRAMQFSSLFSHVYFLHCIFSSFHFLFNLLYGGGSWDFHFMVENVNNNLNWWRRDSSKIKRSEAEIPDATLRNHDLNVLRNFLPLQLPNWQHISLSLRERKSWWVFSLR